jgi:cytochrome c peroxidase
MLFFTLITPNAAFDKFLGGQSAALDARQKGGLKLFMENGCGACHSGINVGGGSYAAFGVVEKPDASLLPLGDAGRFVVTKAVGDKYQSSSFRFSTGLPANSRASSFQRFRRT